MKISHFIRSRFGRNKNVLDRGVDLNPVPAPWVYCRLDAPGPTVFVYSASAVLEVLAVLIAANSVATFRVRIQDETRSADQTFALGEPTERSNALGFARRCAPSKIAAVISNGRDRITIVDRATAVQRAPSLAADWDYIKGQQGGSIISVVEVWSDQPLWPEVVKVLMVNHDLAWLEAFRDEVLRAGRDEVIGVGSHFFNGARNTKV